MPPNKVFETDKVRMPKQHVRRGRGVAGYTGKVEIYDTDRPKGFADESVARPVGLISTNRDGNPTKEQLKVRAAELGLSTGGNVAELTARIRLAEKQGDAE